MGCGNCLYLDSNPYSEFGQPLIFTRIIHKLSAHALAVARSCKPLARVHITAEA